MTDRVKRMLDFHISRSYRSKRDPEILDVTDAVKDLDSSHTQAFMLETNMNNETPIIYEDDIFGFNSSRRRFARGNTWSARAWLPSNNTVNYDFVINNGFDAILELIADKKKTCDGKALEFYALVEREISTMTAFCDKYHAEAEKRGLAQLSRALENIPRKGATSLYEACQFQKLLIYALRCTGHAHVTLGRFDQYMYKYYEKDVARGMSRDELFEILELYFIALNMDTDLYSGIQQGDNGQSMVLGGFDPDGTYKFNELSEMCLEASCELGVIDPKINLRVGKDTPDHVYELGTKLTKKGLGFPQYCNDDVITAGLIKLGYDIEDAYNYTVAACWEAIVPNVSMDIPNIVTMNFPLVVNNAIHARLGECETFEELLSAVEAFIAEESRAKIEACFGRDKIGNGKALAHSPLMSIMVDGCLETGRDVGEFAAKYYNLGCHGAGIANAADALVAVKTVIYDERSVDKKTLLTALDNNFEGYAELRNKLLSCPKVGNDDDTADAVMVRIMHAFSENLNGKPTGSGGVWRAGTGSAMEYILSAAQCPATADGRLSAAPYSSSYSPSITTRLNGPLSTIMSFTKPDLTETVNGGPLTMEIHDNVFRNPEGEKKVAQLVKLFVMRGGHQLQLNSICRDKLIDAQKHPENYPNLIVRVWGWSGYFTELDKEYQNHIISRTHFSI